MGTTEVSQYNLALGHLGIGKTVGSVTEKSAERMACTRFFNDSVRTVLSTFPFPQNKKTITLALIEADPTTEWGYSYQYPNDCLVVSRILSGERNDDESTSLPYEIYQDNSKKVIYTDAQSAVIAYIAKDSLALWPEDLALAHSFFLAFLIAPQVAKNNPNNKLGLKAFESYNYFISRAIGNRLGEQRKDNPPPDSYTRSRS